MVKRRKLLIKRKTEAPSKFEKILERMLRKRF